MPGSEYINLDKLLLGFGSSSITCAIHFYTNIFTSLLFNFNFLLFFFNLFFYSRAEIESYFFNFQSQPLIAIIALDLNSRFYYTSGNYSSGNDSQHQ